MPGRLAPPVVGSAARAWLLGTTALLPAALLLGGAAGEARAQLMPAPNAAPTGGQVVAGSAAIAQTASRTQITQSTDRAAINWQQFNVGSAHQVDFRQPSAASWTLNRVTGPDPSVIAGRITANGGVALVNSSGVVFADGAQVNVGSLIASASNITNENFMAGRMAFDGAPRPGARVENRGRVTVRERGLAALVAPEVRNSGVIRARLGRVALAGAETFTLDLAGDGLVSIDVTQAVRQAPEGGAALVTNSGVVRAEGGSVLLTAHAASGLVETLVSNGGRISAPTVAATAEGAAPERAGTVALRAEGGGVRVETGGRVAARGGRSARGGAVEVNASGSVTLAPGAVVDVSGGTGGGRATIGTGLASAPGQPVRPAARTEIAAGATVRANATRNGRGGTVLVNSTESTVHRGRIEARGGPQGGDGGFVELSGRGTMQVAGVVDVAAPAGQAGELFLDPQRIRVTDDFATNDDLVLPPDGGGNVFATTSPDLGEVLVRPATIEAFNGTVTLAADLGVRVTAGINKPNGGLTLQTLQPAGTLGLSGISIEAPITLSAGTLTATTAGSIYVDAAVAASNVSLSAGSYINAYSPITAPGGAVTLTATADSIYVGAPVVASNVSLSAGNYVDVYGPISAPGGAVTLTATTGSIYQGSDAAITAATLAASAPQGSVFLDAGLFSGEGGVGLAAAALLFPAPNRVGTLLGGVAADTYYFYNAGPLTVGGAVQAGGEINLTNLGSITIAPAGALTGGGAPFAGIGVMVDATGFIRNEGSITGAASSAYNGVQLHAGTGLVNLGSITGTGGGDLDQVTGEIIRAVSLAAGGAVANEGTIRGLAGASANGGAVGIDGQALANRAAGTIEGPLVEIRTTADINNAGSIRGTGALSFATGPEYGLRLDAGGAIANSGLVETTTARALLNAGSSITNTATGQILGVGLGTSGDAATGVAATAGTFLRNLGTIQGSNADFFSWAADLTAGSAIDNRGLIRGVAGGPDGDGSVWLKAATSIDNGAAGRIESAGQFGYVSLDAGTDIGNAGTIVSTNWVDLSAGGALRNSGTVTAPGSIYLTAFDALTNTTSGSILAAGDYAWVSLHAGGALTNAGQIEARGLSASVSVSANSDIINSGTIASRLGGATDATGLSTTVWTETSLTNSGTIASDGVTSVQAYGGDIRNSGGVTSAAAYHGGNDTIGAAAALFAGGPDPVYSAGYTRVEASGAVVNTGTIAATGTGTTPSGTFFAADAEILAGTEIRNRGSITAAGNVHAGAGSFLDTSGTIEALLGEVRLHAAGIGLPTGQDWAIRQGGGTIRALGTGTAFDSTPGLVDLRADAGGVRQAAGGAIEARLLTGSVAGGASLESPNNLVEALGTFRAGTAATTPGEARFTLRTGSPQLAVGGEVSVGVLDTDGVLIVVQRGGTIGLAADDIAIAPGSGLLRAPDGTVAITPHTAGTHIALARRDAPTGTGSELALDRAELEDGIRADRLVLGAGPDGTAFARAGSIRQYADTIDFRTGENLPAAGTAPGIEGRPRSLELYASGAIQQRGRAGDTTAETEGRGADAADGTRGALRVSNLGGEAGSFAWFGADNGVLHLEGFTAGETVTLRNAPGETLGIANPVRVGAGGRITLATDALAFENDIQGMLSAPGGAIEILPVTAGRRVVFETGPADPTALSLNTIGLGLVGRAAAPTAVLRIGRSEDTAVTGNAAWPTAFGIGRVEVPVGDAGIAGPGPRTAGDIDFAAALSLRSGAVARVGRLELFAGTEGTATGTITQAPGAGIDVAVLAGESRRAALLDAPGNRIDTLAGFRAGMGATTAGQAEFRLASRLDGGNGGADADRPLAVTGEVSVGVRGDGSIARQDGTIDIAAPALALQAADITAPPAADPAASSLVRLEATRGDIIQSGTGRILTGELFAQSARDTLLDAGPNAVQTLLAIDPVTGLLAPRDFRLRVATPITLGGALTAGRDLGIASDATLDVAAGAQVTSGRALDLAAGTDLGIAAGATLGAPGAVALTAGGAVSHAGSILGGSAGLAGTGVRIVAGTTLDNSGTIAGTGGDGATTAAPAVLLRSGGMLGNDGTVRGLAGAAPGSGGVRLDSTGGVIANAGTVEAAGGLVATAGTGIGNSGSLAGGLAGGTGTTAVRAVAGNGDLHNTGSITGIGGSATAPGVSLTARGAGTTTTGNIVNDGSIAAIGSGANQGSLVLDAAGGVTNAGTLVGARDAQVAAGAAIDNAGLIEAGIGRVVLSARGVGLPAGQAWSIRQAGTVAAPANTVLGASSPNAGDAVIRAEAGDVLFAGGSVVTGRRDVQVEALTGGVTADGATLSAGRAMRIEAGTSVAQRGGLIEGETLLARAFDSVTLDAADTAARQGARIQALAGAVAVTGGGTLTAGRELRIEAGNAIQLAGSLLAGETLVARTGGVLRLDGVHFVLGTGALFAAHGGIEAGAMSLVTPHDPAVLPALLFDTRAVTYAAIPGFVQPDVPGLAPEAQATQVRLFGQEAPGDFGPASNQPAGPIQLHLDAGSSPVFLLLDGGVASGGLAAGRLGVHGRGGAADLTGLIGGRADESAALTPGAEITRPITESERGHYRFNGCIIGSVSCAAVPHQLDERLFEQVPILPNVVAEVGSEATTAAANINRLFIPEAPLVQLRRLRDRLADPDVLLPNTVEEDY